MRSILIAVLCGLVEVTLLTLALGGSVALALVAIFAPFP